MNDVLIETAPALVSLGLTVFIWHSGRHRTGVTHQGLGIGEKDMTHLFEPFPRQGAEKSDIEGTGIGLTITRKRVQLMGG